MRFTEFTPIGVAAELSAHDLALLAEVLAANPYAGQNDDKRAALEALQAGFEAAARLVTQTMA